MHRELALAALVACVSLVACTPRDADIRRARVAAERRNLVAALDHLEDRLVLNQSRVRFWREMKDRHESVTAIACASMEEHATEMASRNVREDLQRALARRSSLDRKNVAAVRPAASEGPSVPPPAPVTASAPAP